MATPVSKKVQLDRKSSFLDNISTRVSENKKRKEKVKGSDKMKEKLTKPAGESMLKFVFLVCTCTACITTYIILCLATY